MNKQIYASVLLGLWAVAAQGQTAVPYVPPPAGVPAGALPAHAIPARSPMVAQAGLGVVLGDAASDAPKLTRFNLNFSGGNPQQLVAAIEKATGRPLNVVIPEEYAEEKIPALRMTQVTVPDLFRAMELASIKTIPYRTSAYGPGVSSYQQLNTSISFQTSGAVTDDSIWYFRGRQQPPDLAALETKPAPAKISRFYALTPYLEQGLKVEDITTAIQTGWRMLGEKETPSISFHKETQLLIAVGEPGKLETIDAVLNALRPGMVATPPPPGSFQERIQSIIRQANPPAAPPTPAKAPAAATEP
jgi:hypothetical protein